MCPFRGDSQENDVKIVQPPRCNLINPSQEVYYYRLFVIRGSIQNDISCFIYLPGKEAESKDSTCPPRQSCRGG